MTSATTAKPTMMPAIAMPPPPCVPCDRRICDRATKPKMMPRTAGMPIRKIPAQEQTSDAMAIPLVFAGTAWP